MKLKTLECILEDIETFENPKIELEQYTTSAHIAACILHTAQSAYDDIRNKSVADLGCGSGVLCIGAALLDAKYCAGNMLNSCINLFCVLMLNVTSFFFLTCNLGFDIDPSAIALSSKNAADCDISDRCDFILCDIKNINESVCFKKFDTVIMNPPFGTRDKGADLMFIKTALNMACNAVYSLHKTSTRKFILRTAKKLGVYCKVIGEVRFNLEQSYKFHKQDSVDIQVDLVRFSLKPLGSE